MTAKSINNQTVAIMISVGNRAHLSTYTYPRLEQWARKHHYKSLLITDNYPFLDKSPHFNKLMAHRIAPGYKRYIIVDDDLMLKVSAPAIPNVPCGYIGLCKDAIQCNTEAAHVKWTANTGFIITDDSALYLLEEAYYNGVYKFNFGDGTKKSIWGPQDQGTLNDVLFKNDKIYQLDWRWNYQSVIDYYARGKGWLTWKGSRFYRVCYYLLLLLPFSKNRQLIKKAYGVHMTMGLYPRFFAKVHR